MNFHDKTLPTGELNLALDEALLLDPERGESLRIWEPTTPMVVLGRSSRHEQEVDSAACHSNNASLLRRVSGGATIVTGAGCLMYAVVLDLTTRPEIATIDHAHHQVLKRLADALRPLAPSVTVAGTSDLAILENESLLKFSGNSVRLVRSRLLYHGTLLYDFDLSLISTLLKTPPRQPDYRAERTHRQFVSNFPADRDDLVKALVNAWDVTPAPVPYDIEKLAKQLAVDKYNQPTWNLSR